MSQSPFSPPYAPVPPFAPQSAIAPEYPNGSYAASEQAFQEEYVKFIEMLRFDFRQQ